MTRSAAGIRPDRVALFLWIVSACDGPAETRALAAPARDDTVAGAWFRDATARSGIDFVHVIGAERRWWFPEIMGSGLGWADVDADGDLDLYAVQSGDLAHPGDARGANRMFANRGDGTFVTLASGAEDRGYGMGCAFGDFDADGRVDLYVTNVGPNALYRNAGAGRFEDVTGSARTGDARWGTSCAFLDHDADGDLDLFVVNYVNWSPEREIRCSSASALRDYCSPKNYNAPAADVLYRNDGDGTFTDVSRASGILASFGNGLGISVADFDADGHLDVYVANDLMPNQLWLGRPGGRFEDEALLRGCAVDADGKSEAGMGCVAFDHGDDGDPDVFVTHLEGETNTLYENRAGEFADRMDALGLGSASLAFTGFGVGAHDFDHDGRLDVLVANGRVTRSRAAADPVSPAAFAEENQLFRGVADGRFEVLPTAVGVSSAVPGTSRGAAFGDVDGDGDVDVAYSDNGGALRLLENLAGARGHWIGLRVRARDGTDALGARVRIDFGGQTRWRTVQTAYGYCSSNEPRVHFGLGDHAGPVRVAVHWPDGSRQELGELGADTLHELRPLAGR
jgi:hypothetical protein